MNKVYRTAPDIIALIGDTLPIIEIEVKSIDSSDRLVTTEVTGIDLVIGKDGEDIETYIMTRVSSGVYSYEISNTETIEWEEGEYTFWFKVTDRSGKEYRREGGIIEMKNANKAESYKKEVGGE